MIRDVLLCVHAAGWLVALIVVALRTGEVPPALWSALPFGVASILVALRAGDRRPAKRKPRADEVEDEA